MRVVMSRIFLNDSTITERCVDVLLHFFWCHGIDSFCVAVDAESVWELVKPVNRCVTLLAVDVLGHVTHQPSCVVGAEHRRCSACRCLVSLMRMTSTVLVGVVAVCVASCLCRVAA